MSYLSTIAPRWIKRRLIEGLTVLVIVTILVVAIWFFGKKVFGLDITFLYLWISSSVCGVGMNIARSLFLERKQYVHYRDLAKKWNVKLEHIYFAANLGIFKNVTQEEVDKWNERDFLIQCKAGMLVRDLIGRPL